MATLDIYAALSAAAYNDARTPLNVHPLPDGWIPLDYGVPAAGLTIGAFSDSGGTEIVIAIKGTDFRGDTEATVRDLVADAGLGTGLGSEQLRQAALFYAKIRALNPHTPITLTGH